MHPAPDRRVIDIEAALLQELLNIAQRQGVAKIPPNRTKDETGFGLPPLEDRGSGYHLVILSRHLPPSRKVATHPAKASGRDGFDAARKKRKDCPRSSKLWLIEGGK